jgi:hypothetical protein
MLNRNRPMAMTNVMTIMPIHLKNFVIGIALGGGGIE